MHTFSRSTVSPARHARAPRTLLRHDNTGATAMEYGLIAALIAVAVMATLGGLGGHLDATFGKTSSGLAAPAAPPVAAPARIA
ncbi:MAG: Flp family type IVb pilin [Sphingomonadales bacterium]|nr:Flp family type IVb pilin [Sphingomonadales bacterium]